MRYVVHYPSYNFAIGDEEEARRKVLDDKMMDPDYWEYADLKPEAVAAAKRAIRQKRKEEMDAVSNPARHIADAIGRAVVGRRNAGAVYNIGRMIPDGLQRAKASGELARAERVFQKKHGRILSRH